MEKNKEIENKTYKALKSGDIPKMKKIAIEIIDFLKDKSLEEQCSFLDEYIEPMEITFAEKIKFFLAVVNMNYDLTFTREVVTYWIMMTINVNNLEEFIELITKDENIQSLYVDYFKMYANYHNRASAESVQHMQSILNLPKFKEKVLTDEEFISKRLTDSAQFFQELPKEFGYLISLYDTEKDLGYWNPCYLQELYEKFYGDKLSEEEQLELINLQHEIMREPNILQLLQKDRMADLKYVLKQILIDKNFYKKIKEMKERSGLDIRIIFSLVHKYYNSKFYILLMDENREFDKDTIEKIKYLANENKVQNVEELENFDQIQLRDLQNMKKEIKKDIKSNLQQERTKSHNWRAYISKEFR